MNTIALSLDEIYLLAKNTLINNVITMSQEKNLITNNGIISI